jgi:hypothetical protein
MRLDLLYTTSLWLLAMAIMHIVATLPTLIERLAEDRPLLSWPVHFQWKMGAWLTLALLLSLVTRV